MEKRTTFISETSGVYTCVGILYMPNGKEFFDLNRSSLTATGAPGNE